MSCHECINTPSFHCTCKNILVCRLHLGEHYQLPGHCIESLTSNVNPLKKSKMIPNMISKITSLITFKQNLNSETKKIINFIQKNYQSAITKIDSQIQDLLKSSNKSFFSQSEIDELNSKLSSEPSSQTSDKLFTEIINFYSQSQICDYNKNNDKQKMNKFLNYHNGGFTCLAITKDSSMLVSGSEDKCVRMWNINSKEQVACLNKHKNTVWCLALSHDDSLVVSGSLDRTLILWDIKSGSDLNVLKGHSKAVVAVRFNLDSSVVVSGSSNELIFWRVQTGESLNKISVNGTVWTCVISADNVIFCGIDSYLESRDLISCTSKLSLKAHNMNINAIALSNNENYIVSCSDDKSIKIWENDNFTLIAQLLGHTQAVYSVCFSNNDYNIISSSADESIIIWNIENQSKIHSFKFHSDHIYYVLTSGNYIFSACRDSKIGVARINERLFLTFINMRSYKVRSESIKENLISYGNLNDVGVCDIDSIENSFILQGHTGQVQATCISSKMNFVASASRATTKNLIIWSLKNRSLISCLNGHLNSVFCVDISTDEQFCISGDFDGRVLLWNLENFSLYFEFIGHSGAINSVKFCKNQFAASAGKDKNIFVWDIERKMIHAVLQGHQYEIWKLLVTDDDKYFVSADSLDGIKVWDIENKVKALEFKNFEESIEWANEKKSLELNLERFLF